jgi:epidermal growth factor receptor substrate 15
MKNEDNKQQRVSLLEQNLQKFLSKHNKFIDKLNKKNNELTQIYSLYDELLKLTDSFLKKIKGKTELIFPKDSQKKDNYFYSSFKLINETLEKAMIEDNNFLRDLLSNLNSFMENSKKVNKNLNNELESALKHIEEDKEKLEIQKKLFHESSEKAESNILKRLIEAIKKKETFKETLISNDLFKELKNNYTNYNSSLENINKLIEDCNNKQKSALVMYDGFDSKNYEFINFSLNSFYVNQFTKNNLLPGIIKQLKEMIILNNQNLNNNINTQKMNSSNHKNLFDKLQFENFQSKINFINVENNDDFNRYIFTIELIRKNVGDIYPDISIEKEKERNKIREKIFNLIKQTNNKISEEDKIEIFTLLKEDEYYQKLLLSILNRTRTDSKFTKSKELITFLGNALNIVIDTSKAKKDYDTVKHCIILSQTYFYEDDKKKKKYILDIIKNNSCFHSIEFWRNYIDLLIMKEFIKYQNMNKEKNINVFMKNNVSGKIGNKIGEILFSQLIPHVSNMIELNIDKKLIARICEEFINKYDYLNQSNIDILYSVISQDPEEINKLREEAKREISLKHNHKDVEQKNIKGKEEKEKEKENKDEIKEIKQNKNKIFEDKNEIKDNKNEIIEKKVEVEDKEDKSVNAH